MGEDSPIHTAIYICYLHSRRHEQTEPALLNYKISRFLSPTRSSSPNPSDPKTPLWRTVSKICSVGVRIHWFRVDGRPIRIKSFRIRVDSRGLNLLLSQHSRYCRRRVIWLSLDPINLSPSGHLMRFTQLYFPPLLIRVKQCLLLIRVKHCLYWLGLSIVSKLVRFFFGFGVDAIRT